MSTIRNFVANFSASSNGFKFSNRYFQKAALFRLTGVIIPFPGHGISIGDASKGLCGGMVFAARDYWQIHQPPPADTQNPGPGNPLFDYLVQRLFDSFGISPDHPPS